MKPPAILVVDDDRNVLEVLDARLSSAGFEVLKAARGEDALKILGRAAVDLLISDMKMPGMGGMELFRRARASHPILPVIFLTAYGTIPDAVRAVKEGAVDYIAKPFDGRALVAKITELLASRPSRPAAPDETAEDLFGVFQSACMQQLEALVQRVAQSTVSVLILGESGAGKERVARRIHHLSPRAAGPMVVVDCGATPAGLLESELFGHVRGAFTHAVREKRGLIETADGGTLFLDEIGNISAEMQIRLLRFLEARKIRRVGDTKEIGVDCRIISATNADLSADIATGLFRQDLYYRLRVVTLVVPPLRERQEDIAQMAHHFVTRFCRKHRMPIVELAPETIAWIKRYPWPGNVRELKNALEAGVVFCHDGVLRPDDIHRGGLPEIAPNPAVPGASGFSLEENEHQAILRALQRSGGVQKEAARLLGISRRAIHYKIKKYGIDIAGLKAGIAPPNRV